MSPQDQTSGVERQASASAWARLVAGCSRRRAESGTASELGGKSSSYGQPRSPSERDSPVGRGDDHSHVRNPVYVGKQVWDRRDNATRREQGGSAPWRSEDEWTVCEDAHKPIVSPDLFAAAQARIERKRRAYRGPRTGNREHLLGGMVRCATGHPSLSAYGASDRPPSKGA